MDFDHGLAECSLSFRQWSIGWGSTAEQSNPSHIQGQGVDVERHSCTPGCGQDSAPVGVTAGDGASNQKAGCNRLGDAEGVRIGWGTGHSNVDTAFVTFSVAHDEEREVARDFLECISDGIGRERAGRTGRKRKDGVICTCVAVN